MITIKSFNSINIHVTLKIYIDTMSLEEKLSQLQASIIRLKSLTDDDDLYHVQKGRFDVELNLAVMREVIDKLWSYLDNPTTLSYKSFILAIEFLMSICKQVDDFFKNQSNNCLKECFFTAMKVQILTKKPYHLQWYILLTYLKAFKIFVNLKRTNKSDEEEEEELEDEFDGEDYEEVDLNIEDPCYGCNSSSDNCECDQIYSRFCKLNLFLNQFNLFDYLVGDTVMSVAKYFIERKVSAKCKSNYSFSYLSELSLWVDEYVKKWLVDIHDAKNNIIDKMINSGQVDNQLKDAYADVRVSQMFEIIIEYPNSEVAIQDLKMCMKQTTSSDFRLNLIKSVKQALVDRLLNPGVSTDDILTAYISAIKALRALDPTGLIFQLVTEPVRKYLKQRNDTIRCIVTALVDEDHNSELNTEMLQSSKQNNENGNNGETGAVEIILPSEGERITAANFEDWKPDPIKLSSIDESNRFSDIVSILVNIYETKDLFVEEYQKQLSLRLLNKYGECNFLDIELRNLELLTSRFNDCELNRCEVMLKDVQTSKRINRRILSGDIEEHRLEEFKDLDCLIVSSKFWPEAFGPTASTSDENPTLFYPAPVKESIEKYTKAFETIKASRTLHWRHHLGSVNLDIIINGQNKGNFTVSPLTASIISYFTDRSTWRLSDLMFKTSLPAETLTSSLAFWQRKGFIELRDDKYCAIIK